jgi:ubiquinone/menaquinone biosynthesis C-methylase UbiE
MFELLEAEEQPQPEKEATKAKVIFILSDDPGARVIDIAGGVGDIELILELIADSVVLPPGVATGAPLPTP